MRLVYNLADQSFHRTKSLGILGVSRGLIPALLNLPHLERLLVLTNRPLELEPHAKLRLLPSFDASRSSLHRIWWDQVGVYLAARRHKPDWLFMPRGFSSCVLSPPCSLACYVYDTIHFEYRRRQLAVFSRAEQNYFEKSQLASLRNSRAIFSLTHFSCSQLQLLCQTFKIPTPRIIRAGLGFDWDQVTYPKQDHILVVTGRWPHKMAPQTIRWVDHWASHTGFTGRIKLVGYLPSGLSVPASWDYQPRMPEPLFRQTMSAARAVVVFTDYEGFGMPPVEAICLNSPPVFSDLPVTREVMHGTGDAFSNQVFDTFSAAMNRALRRTPEQIAAWKAELQREHNWHNTQNALSLGLVKPPNSTATSVLGGKQ